MDTTNSSENQQRRLEDRKPEAVIDWGAPGAPAVPLAAAEPREPSRPTFVASMLVNAEGVSVYPTPAASQLPYGHYVLCTGTAPAVAPSTPAATSGDAPTDLQQLKALALAVGDDAFDVGLPSEAADEFMAKVSPAVVLDLIARIERAAAPAPSDAALRALRGLEALADGDYKYELGAILAPIIRAKIAVAERAVSPATASGDELPSIATPDFLALVKAHRIAYQVAVDGFDPSDEKEVDENLNAAWKALVAHIDSHTRAAVSAATKPTADLSGLTRFDMVPGDGGRMTIGAEENGPYVSYFDVQSLLATKPAGVPEDEQEAIGTISRNRADESLIFTSLRDFYVTDGMKVYAAPTAAPADQVRNQALEEAAKVCDALVSSSRELAAKHGDDEDDYADAYMNKAMCASQCAEGIRALKSAAPEGATTDNSEKGNDQ